MREQRLEVIWPAGDRGSTDFGHDFIAELVVTVLSLRNKIKGNEVEAACPPNGRKVLADELKPTEERLKSPFFVTAVPKTSSP